MRAGLAHIVSSAPVGLGDHFRVGRAKQIGQRLHDIRQFVVVVDHRQLVVVPLDVGDLHDQHRMMRGHRPAALGEDVRVRQALRLAEFLEHADHGTGVFVDVVVDRAGIARMGAVVVDTQAAAHVDVIHRQPEGTQFGVITNRFAEALAVVGQIGDLRAHVKMQQADALVHFHRAETLDHREQLRGGQAELGALATGIGPFGRGQRRQSHTQTDLRGQLELVGLLDHQTDLGLLLDDDEHVVAELLAHQCQTDELAILVTIADDGAALRRQRQHGHQLRLGARLQADGNVLRGDDVLHHRFLLVDLDRVQRGVLAGVLHALDVGIECTGQAPHAVLQDAGEAHQQRQRQTRLTQLFDQPVELDRLAARPLRAHFDIALIVDREIPSAPVADTVDAAAVGSGPLATVVFTCASYRHQGLPEEIECFAANRTTRRRLCGFDSRYAENGENWWRCHIGAQPPDFLALKPRLPSSSSSSWT